MSDGLNEIFKDPPHPLYKMIVDNLFALNSLKDIEKMQAIKRRAKRVCREHVRIVGKQADRIEALEKLTRAIKQNPHHPNEAIVGRIDGVGWFEYRDKLL